MAQSSSPLLRVFRLRDFRRLWLGQVTSLLGSQFSFIALPWLVLQLTGSPLALGAVLALGGLPRLAMILVGGAIADRLAPRRILLVCDVLNFALTLALAGLVATGTVQVWMLYGLSLVTGLLGGLVIPAATAIVPALVPAEDLQTGNALTQGNSQFASFVGPVLAGSLIAVFTPGGSHTGAPATGGLALAFGIDAASFAISALMLALMKVGALPAPAQDAENILASIRAGVSYTWQAPALRQLFGLVALTNLLATGPLVVGIPVLASLRLPEGAAAFGIIMSAYGGGNLAGLVLAGALPRPSAGRLNLLLVGLLAGFGVGLLAFGWISTTWVAALVLLALGIGNGYFSILLITQLQRRTPPAMMGRVMSLFMLCVMSLTPLSQMLSGVLSKWSLTGLFALAGGLMLLVAAWIALDGEARARLVEMSGQPAEAA